MAEVVEAQVARVVKEAMVNRRPTYTPQGTLRLPVRSCDGTASSQGPDHQLITREVALKPKQVAMHSAPLKDERSTLGRQLRTFGGACRCAELQLAAITLSRLSTHCGHSATRDTLNQCM